MERKKSEFLFIVLLIIGMVVSLGRNRKNIEDEGFSIFFIGNIENNCELFIYEKEAVLAGTIKEEFTEKICSLLKEYSISKLKYVIVCDDEVKGIEKLIKSIDIETIITAYKEDIDVTSYNKAKKRGTLIKHVCAGDFIQFNKAVITFVSPVINKEKGTVISSELIFRIDYKEYGMLVINSALTETQSIILKEDYRIKADVLYVSENIFDNDIDKDFFKTAAADYIITCTDKDGIKKLYNFCSMLDITVNEANSNIFENENNNIAIKNKYGNIEILDNNKFIFDTIIDK